MRSVIICHKYIMMSFFRLHLQWLFHLLVDHFLDLLLDQSLPIRKNDIQILLKSVPDPFPDTYFSNYVINLNNFQFYA